MVKKQDGDVFTDQDHTDGTQVIEVVDPLPDPSERPEGQMVLHEDVLKRNIGTGWDEVIFVDDDSIVETDEGLKVMKPSEHLEGVFYHGSQDGWNFSSDFDADLEIRESSSQTRLGDYAMYMNCHDYDRVSATATKTVDFTDKERFYMWVYPNRDIEGLFRISFDGTTVYESDYNEIPEELPENQFSLLAFGTEVKNRTGDVEIEIYGRDGGGGGTRESVIVYIDHLHFPVPPTRIYGNGVSEP